jgi:type IV secretory pathway VirB9-like protein
VDKSILEEQKKLELKIGDQKKIDLKVIFKDGYSEYIQDAQWKSDDESIATVENGVITAVGFGKTKVIAAYMGKKVIIEVVNE